MLTLQEAREFFSNDLYGNRFSGAVIENVSYEFARCRMEIKEMHLNAAGYIHGGAIFTLGDFAFAVAANCSYGLTVSLSNQITFHRSSMGRELIAEASRINRGSTTCFYNVRIYDNFGADVATMTVNGFIKSNR